jgi:Flp pilus assembly protein TadD/predicted RNA-binding Zn-ribbon protein involved in translation (DUF1610 family)
VAQTRICESCGAKIAATRERCPKCRATIVRVDPRAQAVRSRKLARASGILFGTFVLVVGVLWMIRGADPAPKATTSKAAVATRRSDAVGAKPAVEAEKQRAFLEPSGAATIAYDSGDYATALAQFEAAVAKNPTDAESMSNLGQVLVKLGRTAEAIPHFERACALNPDRWAYRFNLARALGLLQRWDESIAAYQQAQQLFPDDYVTTFNLAMTMHKKGDDAGAVEEYKKAVALNPEDPSFRMALAISLEALQRRQDAAAAYGEYLRLSPSAPDAEKVRARIALLTGQPAPATPAAQPASTTTGL